MNFMNESDLEANITAVYYENLSSIYIFLLVLMFLIEKKLQKNKIILNNSIFKFE